MYLVSPGILEFVSLMRRLRELDCDERGGTGTDIIW